MIFREKATKVSKRLMSLVLCAVMIFGVFGSGLVAFADNSGRILSSGWDDIVISVPETVYMTPQYNFGDTTTSVQYYVNNTVNSSGEISLDSVNNATSGKFFIYSKYIKSVNSVVVNGATLSDFSASKSGNLFSDTSFSLTLASANAIKSKEMKTLEWTINCTMSDDTSAVFYAYTIAYNPYLSAVVSAARIHNCRGKNMDLEGFAWTSGIHGIESDGSWYTVAGCSPLGHSIITGGGNNYANDNYYWNSCIFSSVQFGQDKKNGYFWDTEGGDYNYGGETDEVQEVTPWGLLTVDTSRNTNLNTIPNITTGFHITDTGTESGGGSPKVYGYICNTTESIATKKDGDGHITSGEDYWRDNSKVGPWYKERGTILWGDTTDTGTYITKSDNCHETKTALWDCSVANNGTQYCYTKSGLFAQDDEGNRNYLNLVGRVKVTKVNKSSWRNAINDAQKYGFQSGWFTNATDFNNWKNSLKSVYEAVCNPTNSTAPSTTNLSSYTNTLKTEYSADSNRAQVSDLGVVKVLDSFGNFSNKYKVISLDNVTNPVEYEPVKAGYAVTLKSALYSNFTYKGNLLSKNQKNAGTDFTNSNLNTGLGIINTGANVEYKHITQTQITNGEHRRTFYYLGNDKTVKVDPNGGLWNGRDSVSTVTGSYKTEWSLALPSRNDFAFEGWSHTAGTDSAYSENYSQDSNTGVKTFTETKFTFGSSEATLTAKWIRTSGVYVYDTGLPTELKVTADDVTGISLGSVSVPSGAKYTAVKSGNSIIFTPGKNLSESVTFTCIKNYSGKAYTQQVTVIPATSVYYEEDSAFVKFNGDRWTDEGSKVNAVADTVSDVYGGLSAYDNTASTTYSLGSVKKATVSNSYKGGTVEEPFNAQFTFTGTGFEVYSLTDSTSGLVLIDIVNVNDSNDKYPTTMVNTYLGYSYGPLYLNESTNEITLNASGNKPVYYTDDTGAGTFYIGDYTKSHTSTRGTTDNTVGTVQANGWVQENNGSLYQVPVISRTDLEYGTYTVTISPRYSKMQSGGRSEYSFYFDSVRIYNPVNPDDTLANNTYKAAGEYNPQYKVIRDLLISSDATNTSGIALIDKKGDSVMIEDYEQVGPKNETYITAGQSIGFNLTTDSTVIPEKIAIGVRIAKGRSTGTLTVNGNNINVKGSTEIYRDISNYVEWEKVGNEYKTKDPVVITNSNAPDSGIIISLTKIRWSFGNNSVSQSGNAPQLTFSFDKPSLLASANIINAAFSPVVYADSSAVTVEWENDSVKLGETAKLIITATTDYEKAFVDGAEIAGYTEDGGKRTWTYTFTAEELGDFMNDVTLIDVNGYETKAIATGKIKVSAPVPDIDSAHTEWENDKVTAGDTAVLKIVTPSDIVKVKVGKNEITEFTSNEDGTREFRLEMPAATAGEYKYSVIITEKYGYSSVNGETPLLTVEAPENPATPENPETPENGENTENTENGDKEETLSFFQRLMKAIIGLFTKIANIFKGAFN